MEKQEISKTKVVLFILLVISIIMAIVCFVRMQNKYNLEVVKNNMSIEYLDYDYVDSKTLSVTEIPKAKNILLGGPFHFNENIMVSSGMIVNVQNKGYIDDITNGEVTVDFLGHDYVNREKYMALYVTVYNNTSKGYDFDAEDFEVGYTNKDNVFKKFHFNNSGIKNLKGVFSLNTISPYTLREGYVFIPIKDTELKNFYFKINIDNIPIVITK